MKLQTQEIRLLRSILRKHQIQRAHLFGSYARGVATKTSDIDVLIELPDKKTLFDLAEIKFAAEDKLHKKVDLVTRGALNPRLREHIKKDLVSLL